MEHEVVPEPGREVQLREVISHLLTVPDPLAAWYLLTRTSRKSMTLRAQGQAVDGPDDEVSFPCTKRSSTSLSKIIPTDLRDLGCSGVAWPEQRRGESGPKQLRGGWECPQIPSQRPRCRRSAKSAHGVGHRNPLRAVGLTMSVVFSSHLPIGRMCVVGLAVGGGWA